MFYNVIAQLHGKSRAVHILPATRGEFLFAVIDTTSRPSTRAEAFVSREDVIRLRDDLNAYLGEDPAPRRLCDAAPTEPAPASCTSLLDGEGDWWVLDGDNAEEDLFFLAGPRRTDGLDDLDSIIEDFGIDPGAQPEPNPIGAVVYITGDDAEWGHFFPVGTEVTVTGVDEVGVIVTDGSGLDQFIAEADLDIEPPPGPYHVGAQVHILGSTAIIVEDLGTQTDAFGRDHHFYTVAREDNPYPPGCSSIPGAATFTADFIDGPTGDAPWTPWDVKRLVRNLAEESDA